MPIQNDLIAYFHLRLFSGWMNALEIKRTANGKMSGRSFETKDRMQVMMIMHQNNVIVMRVFINYGLTPRSAA